jgi:hypothetical protein
VYRQCYDTESHEEPRRLQQCYIQCCGRRPLGGGGASQHKWLLPLTVRCGGMDITWLWAFHVVHTVSPSLPFEEPTKEVTAMNRQT